MEIGFDGDLQSVRCYYPVCLRETKCASIKVDSSRITIFLVFTFASISAWINAGPAGISEVSNMHDYIVKTSIFLEFHGQTFSSKEIITGIQIVQVH